MKKMITLCAAVSVMALGACSSNDNEVMYENSSEGYAAHTARVESQQAPYKVSRELNENAPAVRPVEPAPEPMMEEKPMMDDSVATMEPIQGTADRVFDERLTK